MRTISVFNTITWHKEQWFVNFIGNELVPPEDMLQSMIAEWGGKFSWHIDPVHGQSLYPWLLTFEKNEDATLFLLKWS